MAALSIQPTYPIFTDVDGQPLEAGYIWVGAANLDPQTNPISVFWDADLTIAATQPIRTLAGYPSNSGTPARLYTNEDYSIRVMNKKGSVVYSALRGNDRQEASSITATDGESGALWTTVQGFIDRSFLGLFETYSALLDAHPPEFALLGARAYVGLIAPYAEYWCTGSTWEQDTFVVGLSKVIKSGDNITTAFEDAILSALDGINGKVLVRLPSGEFTISRGIVLPTNFVGLGIRGSGKRSEFAVGRNNRGTMLRYTGSGTMLTLNSAAGVVMEDLGIVGSGKDSGQTCIKYLQPGNGSGLSTYTRVYFGKFSIAMQFGNAPGDGGCADVGYDFCDISECDTGIKVVNNDGANYSFNRLYAGNTRTLVDSLPGSFNFKNSQIVACGELGRNVFNFTNVGDNSSFLLFDGVRIEQGTVNFIKAAGTGRLHIIGLEEAQPPSGSTQIDLVGVNAKVETSRFTSGTVGSPLSKVQANGGAQRGFLEFEKTHFQITADKDIYQKIVGFPGSGFANGYRVRDCTAGSAKLTLPEMGGKAYSNKVVLCAQTTTTTPVELTTTGGAAAVDTRIDTQYGHRLMEIVVLGVSGANACRFARQVLFSNTAIINIQTIGSDVDAIGGCSVLFPATDNNGLRITVTGPAAICDWRAVATIIASGFL